MSVKGISFLALIFLTVIRSGCGQTYPSALVTQMTGPRTIFFDEYADPFQPKIKTTIYFTDFTTSSWQFALRLKISGPGGITISTRPGSRPLVPLSVAPGQPLELAGADLAFYFDYDNLLFAGISRQQLELNHRLPEGLYTFCFEAVDYESGRPLSHPSCASAYLSLLDPPIVLTPQHGQVIENISMQNMLLQWQPGNVTGNLDLNLLRYEVDLYEVTAAWVNPVTAIINNQALPIWRSQPLTQNVYVYSSSDPPLDKGKRYVFTVRAYEVNGRGRFKNNGYSVPRFFRFGYDENDTLLLSHPPQDHQFTLSSPSVFSWSRPPKSLPSQMFSYTLRLVAVDSSQSPEAAILLNQPFFQTTYLPTNNQEINKTIPVTIWANIGRMQQYAWQVTAQSGMQQVAKSQVRTFTGPPDIESFIAGGFVMTVTRLDHYDKTNKIIGGKCQTVLRGDSGAAPTEFSFTEIGIAPIGNNQWVMETGMIADRITATQFTLSPHEHLNNGPAYFEPDSVLVTTSGLKLGGTLSWELPHFNIAGEKPLLRSRHCRLGLANLTFHLSGSEPVALNENYNIDLLDPLHFRLRLAQSSAISVYQSAYSLGFSGFMQLPSPVVTVGGTPVHLAFSGAEQLFLITETGNENSEAAALARNAMLDIQPLDYSIDLDDETSPGEFSNDGAWKGIHIGKARLTVPLGADRSGQLTVNTAVSHTISNGLSDTVTMHVDHKGFDLNASVVFGQGDSLKFNDFVSTQAHFYAKVHASSLVRAGITGSIQVPVIDTLKRLPYFIELGEYGFNEGYLLNGLAGTTFTFNAGGSMEQRVVMTIRRAVFRSRNRLEMDLDVAWPQFSLTMVNVQRFSAWGNNNIGFDVPNGRHALNQQAHGKAAGFDMTVDQIGCGRSGNVYAFGASAKISMDEEISGDHGPPVVNAYSIYRNPLLSGAFIIPIADLRDSLIGTQNSGSATPPLQGAAAGYSAAVSAGLGDALARLQFNPADTAALHSPEDESRLRPLVQGNAITEIGKALEIVYRLKPFIGSSAVSDRDWMVLDRMKKAIAGDLAQQSQVTNAKGLFNFALNKVVEGLTHRLNDRIESVAGNAVGKVRNAVNNKIAGPVNIRIDEAVTSVFAKLQQAAAAQAGEEHHAAIADAFGIAKTSISTGIRNAVLNSFETNITSKLDRTVYACVVSKITGYVRQEVTAAGQKLLTDGVHAQISLSQIFLNGHTMFTDVADTVKDVIMDLNGHNFVNTAQNLVDDAISGIDWNAVAVQITSSLVQKGISQVLASQLTGAIAENAGVYASAILSTVKFDFSNIGQKLQNGQLDQVVKFDPTNIYIQSPAVDVRGKLIFTKGDPVYGDSWQADVMVRVKIPKKDNPIECTGYFINGKTTQTSSFTYWLVKLSVTGLNVPLTPAPLVWDGALGMAYSKMKKVGPEAVTPDATSKFGVACRFTFLDQQSSGGTLILALGAEAEFNEGGFSIELNGNASMLNFQKESGKYKGPGFVTGTGCIGYYKTPQMSKIAGNFNVQLNTQPILCAGGSAGFDLRGPSNWKVWVGTPEDPFGVKLLCKDFLKNTAYLQVSNTGFGAGIMCNVDVNAQSPWLHLSGVKVRGFAYFELGYNVSTSIEWEPEFKITEATLSAWVSAGIGIDYETVAGPGSITLAGVSLSGTLSYKSQPESELHGALSGNITVVGFSVGFDTDVHYSLSKQQMLN